MVSGSREERKTSVYSFRNSEVGKLPELLDSDIQKTREHKVQHPPLRYAGSWSHLPEQLPLDNAPETNSKLTHHRQPGGETSSLHKKTTCRQRLFGFRACSERTTLTSVRPSWKGGTELIHRLWSAWSGGGVGVGRAHDLCTGPRHPRKWQALAGGTPDNGVCAGHTSGTAVFQIAKQLVNWVNWFHEIIFGKK